MYATIIPLKTDNGCYIIKFGYTYNLVDRIESLEIEYKSPVYLLRAKFITSKQDEERFHNLLKIGYKSLIERYKINSKNKVELYKFTPKLLIEFENYLNDEKTNDEFNALLDLELEVNQNFGKMYSDKMIDYLIKKSNNEYKKSIMQLKYNNSEQTIKINESETRLLEAKIKLFSINKPKLPKNKQATSSLDDESIDDESIDEYEMDSSDISSESEDMSKFIKTNKKMPATKRSIIKL